MKTAKRTKEKAVLVLGPYNEESISTLKKISNNLKDCGYLPIILSEYPDIPEQSLPEKMLFLGTISRFIIICDTTPSGHLVETELCANANFTTAIIRNSGLASTWMQHDITKSNSYMKAFQTDDSDLEDLIRLAISWGEKVTNLRTKEYSKEYSKEYPWIVNSNISL